MRALALAAGRGERLRPLTESVPKCLVPIQGRPLLDYWLALLFGAGIERTLINTHWLADRVVEHVSRSPWRTRIDIVHEPELLGTGGTVLANSSYFGSSPFLLLHADNLAAFDVSRLMRAHAARPADCAITMLAFRTDDPGSCGILELGSEGRVVAFHEKVPDPPGNLANAAVYVIEPEVVAFIAGLGKPFVDFSTEVLPNFVGRMQAIEIDGYLRDIGTPESYRRAQLEFGRNGNCRPWSLDSATRSDQGPVEHEAVPGHVTSLLEGREHQR